MKTDRLPLRERLREMSANFRHRTRELMHRIRTEYQLFLKSPVRWLWQQLMRIIRGLLTLLGSVLKWPVRVIHNTWRWFRQLTIRAVWRTLWRSGLVLVVLMASGFFLALHWPHSQVPEAEPPDQIVFLDQGWGVGRNAADRQTYYYTPQGASTMLRNLRYDWLVHMEVPWGSGRLADPELMRAWGFQVDNAATPANPHQLPVGFTRHFDPVLQDHVLDISCATCHTGALRVRQGDGSLISLRIDGGQAMHAFTTSSMPHFLPVLITSMMSTYLNPFKFDRFARKVLAEHYHNAGKRGLRREFWITLSGLLTLGGNEILHGLAPVPEGFGRTDALTRIANRVFGDHITPDNNYPGNAPVSYPPVWDIWKFDWVQYSASVSQPMARNLGESLGVGAKFNFLDNYARPLPQELQFDTSSRFADLHTLELTLRKLRPPAWPEQYLGQIDREKAVRGGIHFIRTCQGCHGPHPANERARAIEMPMKGPDDPHWAMKLLSIQEIGTDPNAAVNFVERKFDLSSIGMDITQVRQVVGQELNERMRRTLAFDFPLLHEMCSAAGAAELPSGLTGGEFSGAALPDTNAPGGESSECAAWRQQAKQLQDEITRELDAINLSSTTNGQALNYVGLLMKQKAYRDAGYSAEQIRELNGFDALDIPRVQLGYKARPLAGAWATAPYLHNGSVRNLYQLLSPHTERDARFFTGRPEFDPVQLGLAAGSSSEGGMWLDTRLSGNANTGHEFRDGYLHWQEGVPPQYGVIGPEYSDAERYEIIEYVKVHHDDPPHSSLFDEVFAGIVSFVSNNMPPGDAPQRVPEFWPEGQACNLQRYLGNHQGASSLSDTMRQQIASIQSVLTAYFELPESYACGGQTRFQRGGVEHDQTNL